MILKLLSYLKFVLHSTNEHDVHSPFVFSFVTNCLYQKPKNTKEKTLNVTLTSIGYFHCKSVYIDNHDTLKKKLKDRYPNLVWDSKPFDLIYLKAPSFENLKKILSKKHVHNDSMILIGNIYKNRETLKIWKSIVDIPEITVSIDMFYCGALFVRKEQVKEHFTIRI